MLREDPVGQAERGQQSARRQIANARRQGQPQPAGELVLQHAPLHAPRLGPVRG